MEVKEEGSPGKEKEEEGRTQRVGGGGKMTMTGGRWELWKRGQRQGKLI